MVTARIRLVVLCLLGIVMATIPSPRDWYPIRSTPEETPDQAEPFTQPRFIAWSDSHPEYASDPTPLPAGAISRIRNIAFRHPARICGLAISSDSSTAYTIAGNATFAWNLRTGELLWVAKDVLDIDEREALYPSWLTPRIRQVGSVVRIWSRASGKPSQYIDLDAAMGLVVARWPLGGDGATLYPTTDRARYIRYHDVTSQNGPCLIDVCDATGRLPSFTIDAWRYHGLLFSPDGRHVFNGRSLYSGETGQLLRVERAPNGDFFEAQMFTPDGKQLICVQRGQKAFITFAVDVESGKWRELPSGQGCHWLGNRVRFDMGWKTIAVPTYMKLEIRDRETLQLRQILDTDDACGGEYTPDGKWFVSVQRDRLLVYDVETGVLIGPPVSPTQVRWAGNTLVMLAGPSLTSWDPRTGKRLGSFPVPHDFAEYHDRWNGGHISPDGKRVAYRTTRQTVGVLELATGVRSEFPTVTDNPSISRFFRSGQLLIVGDDGVRIGNTATGSDSLVIPRDFKGRYVGTTFDISPDDRYIADAGSARLGLWDLKTNQAIQLRGWDFQDRHFARFTPDGRHLIGRVKCYGRTIEEHNTTLDLMRFVCMQSDPQHEFKIAVWEVPSGRQVKVFPMSPSAWGMPVVLPDSRTLAYLDQDACILLVELATGKPRHYFRTDGFQHPEGLYGCIDASPDGRFLTSIVAGSVLVWDVRGELSRPRTPPDARTLTDAWNALAQDDAVAAFHAVRLFAATPEQSLPFLRERLGKVQAPNPTRVASLIASLADPDFHERERSTTELQTIGRLAVPAMRESLKGNDSPEATHRLLDLLRQAENPSPTPNELRAIRAVEAVEWIGSPEACELLEMWASGVNARLTHEAKGALTRLRD